MVITRAHITGFAVGVGVSALGYYAYKKNQSRVDDFLRQQGIQIPVSHARDFSKLSLEELVSEKERLEDIIAEREMLSAKPEEA